MHQAINPSSHPSIRRFINHKIQPYSDLSKHPPSLSIIHPYNQPCSTIHPSIDRAMHIPSIHYPSIQPAINQTNPFSRYSSYKTSISNLSSCPSFDQFITQPSYVPASLPYFSPTICTFEHQAIQPAIQLDIYRSSVYLVFHRFN